MNSYEDDNYIGRTGAKWLIKAGLPLLGALWIDNLIYIIVDRCRLGVVYLSKADWLTITVITVFTVYYMCIL